MRIFADFILFLGLLCLGTAGPVPESENVHKLMTDDEVMRVFRTERHAVPQYQVIPVNWPRQHKRSDESSIRLNINAFGNDIKLWLNADDGILAGEDTPVYFARSTSSSSHDIKCNIMEVENPMADVGKMLSDREERASIIAKRYADGTNVITGIVGLESLIIRPLPNHINNYYSKKFQRSKNNLQQNKNEHDEPHYHVVYKQTERDVNANRGFIPEAKKLIDKQLDRSEHEINVPEVTYPQVLVFADYETYKLHGENLNNLLEYMLPLWNGVDLRYRSLENPKVRFNIAGIVVAKDPKALPFISNWVKSKDSFNVFDSLPEFATFLENMEDKFDRESYDVAITITPYKMCNNETDDCNILGRAFIGGACKHNRVGIIIDRGAFDGIHTAAHELAHLFGSKHDGEDDSTCDENDGHIMSPNQIRTEHSADWSICTLESFATFFRSLNGSKPDCLFNKPKTKHPLPRVMPGTLMTRDDQCKKMFGTKTCNVIVEEKEICIFLPCQILGSNKCDTTAAPVDGSICGTNKICIHGKCVDQSEIL